MIDALDPALGGPAVILPEMAAALGRYGKVDVTIFAASAHVSAPEPSSVRDVPVWLYPFASSASLRRRSASWALARALWRRVGHFDIVHTHGIFGAASVAACAACRAQRVPYVMRPCGALDEWSLAQGSRLKRPFLFALTRPALRAASFVHCTSEQEAEQVRRLESRARTVVVPHGIDTEEYALASPDSARARYGRYVLFLGRLHAKKCPDVLLRAFAEVVTKVPDLQLVLAGPDEGMRPGLELLARELGVRDRVHFPGLVTGDQKRGLLRGATVFALPSHQENFGISVLEACAAGCPPVVSRGVALCSEVAAFGAGEVADVEPRAFAAGIAQVLAERQKYEAGCRRMADAFSWQVAAQKLAAAYRRALGNAPDSATRTP